MDERAKILVIDDEAAIQKLMRSALERDGYEVVGALDAASGLIAFERERPDLVLLDVMLPDMSGRDVCQRLRATSRVPIMMVSALDEEVDKVVGLELGADDYITKPFGVRELRSRIKAVLRRVTRNDASEVAGTLDLAGVVLDPVRHTVVVDGAQVDVTFVEFELLRTMMASPGRVFSRARLLESVWGSSDYREPRTIDVHVRHLREKIERDPSAPVRLQTVRGVGYRFADGGA